MRLSLPVKAQYHAGVPYSLDEGSKQHPQNQPIDIEAQPKGQQHSSRQAANVVGHKVYKHAPALQPSTLHMQSVRQYLAARDVTCCSSVVLAKSAFVSLECFHVFQWTIKHYHANDVALHWTTCADS